MKYKYVIGTGCSFGRESWTKEIVRSYGIVSAEVTMRSLATHDHIVDTLAGNCVYSSAVVVINKVDFCR